jgi:CDP-diacylglycerol--serine O-phosphatidyltransferase
MASHQLRLNAIEVAMPSTTQATPLVEGFPFAGAHSAAFARAGRIACIGSMANRLAHAGRFTIPPRTAKRFPGLAANALAEPHRAVMLSDHILALPSMTPPTPYKPFSMIREFHLADWFTLANAVCGTGALFSILTYLELGEVIHVQYACGLVLAALIFDVLDGRIARWRQSTSTLGRELDSLADIISFGVAPAIIAYGCGMQGLYDRVVLAFFVACGVSRLARYNITAEALSEGTGKVRYFEGTPIPTSIALVLLMAIAARTGAVQDNLWFGVVTLAGFKLHPLVLLFAISGSLMISRLRIPKP